MKPAAPTFAAAPAATWLPRPALRRVHRQFLRAALRQPLRQPLREFPGQFTGQLIGQAPRRAPLPGLLPVLRRILCQILCQILRTVLRQVAGQALRPALRKELRQVLSPALRLPMAAAVLGVAMATPSWAAPAGPAEAQGQPAQARHLGRLFSTPQQRALLDARRDGSAVEGQPATATPLPPSPPAPMQLNGVVQRSNGATTVWLNDAPLAERDSQVLPDRSVSLRLPSGKRITLKPGQRYDEATGTIANAGQ